MSVQAVKAVNADLDTPQERRLLWVAVLGGHALLLGLLIMQKPLMQPKPLEIELSLSAESFASEPRHQLAIPKTSSAQTIRPLPIPTSIPSTPIDTAPAQLPTAAKPSAEPTAAHFAAQAASVMPSQPVLVLPNADAAYLTNPKPGYPPLSRRLGEQGVVTLTVLVGTSGEAQRVELAKSSGYLRLDEAAIRAVQGWRFSPGKRAGNPEAMSVRIPISFILEK